MAEQPAVNRQVLGSNPSQGASHFPLFYWLIWLRFSLRKFSANLVTTTMPNL